MRSTLTVRMVLAVLGVALCASASAADPLSYLYQDPAVSQDSFAYNPLTENMGGIARRGVNAYTLENGTAERAYESFVGPGDGYLDYTEDFDFSFDMNFSAAGTGADERAMFGLWYSPEDAQVPPPDQALIHYLAWGNRQHFVGFTVGTTLDTLRFGMFFSNGGNWAGRSEGLDVTGDDGLLIGTDYRVEGHYRYDGSTYGQVFGEVYAWEGGGWVLKWSLAQQVITQDTDVYDVGYVNFTGDVDNRQFRQLSTMGVGNETWGSAPEDGPVFTSDNWYLGLGAETWVNEGFAAGAGPGDVDGNGVVDGLDLTAVLTAWETIPGDPLWNPAADLDANDIVDGLDLTEVISNWTVAASPVVPEPAACVLAGLALVLSIRRRR